MTQEEARLDPGKITFINTRPHSTKTPIISSQLGSRFSIKNLTTDL